VNYFSAIRINLTHLLVTWLFGTTVIEKRGCRKAVHVRVVWNVKILKTLKIPQN
jgi:hypothetical protein